jgi:fructose/tagatose bisphosphate aldolase
MIENIREIDNLVYKAVFGSPEEKQEASYQIWHLGAQNGVILSSINDLYMARGRGEISEIFTVPAMNLRGMTYDLARSVFIAAKKQNVGPMIFEIARSEMGYTNQTPLEYTTVVMAAALRESWSGPLFIQGDHFQAKAVSVGVPKEGEIDAIKDLIKQAISAGFYNIDIDMSTLVDLMADTVEKEQIPNIKYSLELVKFVRGIEPKGVTISLGAEIGHIGGKNSTVEDFRAFITGFNAGLPKDMVGISKISVATGTSHGGVVLADGTLADIALDFSILSKISKECRKDYGIGGTVQHGASTLPEEYFSMFPKSDAIEVHLATGFQNIQMDHPQFPKELLQKMYSWIDETKQAEKTEDMTEAQFHYSLRKKAWGEFKKECWNMPEENRLAIMQTLTERFEFLFKQLGVVNTRDVLDKYVKPVLVEKTKADFMPWEDKPKDVVGLSD